MLINNFVPYNGVPERIFNEVYFKAPLCCASSVEQQDRLFDILTKSQPFLGIEEKAVHLL